MKLADFDFRLALTPEVMADIACDNKDCPCQTPLLYGEQARNHFNDPLYKDCEVRWWSGFYDSKGAKIYDGDIVKHVDMQDLCCITLHTKTGSGVFYICNAKIPRELHHAWGDNLYGVYSENGYKGSKIECIEIVGNIHENADLLKEQK